MPRHCVVGNPDNRRVHLFAAAVRGPGGRRPGWCPGATSRPAAGARSARTSPSGSTRPARTPRSTGCCGAPPSRPSPARSSVRPPGTAGFAAALHRVATAARDGGARLLTDPAEVPVMFDKRACHARLAAAGRRRCRPALAPVRELCRSCARPWPTAGWSRVFVKPAYGSSASGVLALAVRGAAGSGRRPRSSWSGPAGGAPVQLAAGARLPTTSATSPPSWTRSPRTGCTSSGGSPRPVWAGAWSTCGWSWSPAGRRTSSCGPAGRP